MRVDQNDRLVKSKAVDSNSGGIFLITGLLIACLSGSVWYFGCELGVRPCAQTLKGIEVLVTNDTDQADMLKKIEQEPCNRELFNEALRLFSDQLLTSQKADILFNFGESDCSFNSFERSSIFISSYSYASRSNDYDRSKKALARSLVYDSSDASVYLTLGKLESGAEKFDDAIDAFRVGIFLADGYSKTGVQPLWLYSDSLIRVGRPCESLSVLEHLRIRTKEQSKVMAKLKDVKRQYDCGLKRGDPIIVHQGKKGVIVVDVEINEKSGRFVFDSGASLTLLSQPFAERAGISPNEKSTISMLTANGKAVAYPSRATTLKFGGETWLDVPVVVSQKDLGRYDGLLGLEFISQFNIEKTGSKWRLTPN